MVPMRMDFYRYRDEAKRAILQRAARLDSVWDPFTASWLAYALGQDGFEGNPELLNLVQRLRHWAENDEVWTVQRNLGALCFLGYFLSKMSKDARQFIDRVWNQIEIGLSKKEQGSSKFSPMNDPEQVFPMALLVNSLKEIPQNLKDSLKEVARTRMQGPLKRRILFCAALRELGEDCSISKPIEDLSDPGDVIALVWYWERYAPSGERAKWWENFEKIKDGLYFDQNEMREGARVLSDSELALLYEALTRETADPDPNLLFEFYPLHPRVKEIAASLFKNKEYKNAVEEAAHALNAFIQDKTGSKKSEAELIQSVMKSHPPQTQIQPLFGY